MRSGRLECPRQEVEDHLRSIHSNSNREVNLGNHDTLMTREPPNTGFDEAELKLQGVREVINKARAGSAPGPNGITFRVYKNCSRLLYTKGRRFSDIEAVPDDFTPDCRGDGVFVSLQHTCRRTRTWTNKYKQEEFQEFPDALNMPACSSRKPRQRFCGWI